MMAPTHLVFGACAGLAAAAALNAPYPLALAGVGALAALLPDIDHPQGTLRQRLGIVGHVGLFWLGHRGLTHTALALALVSVLAWAAAPGPLAMAIAAGYGSHLIADMLTRQGLPVLWPLSSRSLHLVPGPLRIRTGSFGETLMFALLLVALWGLYA
jgi:inner membrane protein